MIQAQQILRGAIAVDAVLLTLSREGVRQHRFAQAACELGEQLHIAGLGSVSFTKDTVRVCRGVVTILQEATSRCTSSVVIKQVYRNSDPDS